MRTVHRNTDGFPCRGVTYRSFDDSPEKRLRLRDNGKYGRLVVHEDAPWTPNIVLPSRFARFPDFCCGSQQGKLLCGGPVYVRFKLSGRPNLASGQAMPKVFVSCRREETAYASDWIAHRLASRFGNRAKRSCALASDKRSSALLD